KGDWRAGYFNPENLRATVERVEALKAILPGSMSLPEMALRFILSNPVVSTTIVGMRKLDHVRTNLAFSDAGPLHRQVPTLLKEYGLEEVLRYSACHEEPRQFQAGSWIDRRSSRNKVEPEKRGLDVQ